MADRAEIFEKDNPGSRIEFQFNPETVGFTKAGKWTETPAASAEDGPTRQYSGPGPIEISLKMLLDDTIRGGTSVADRVNQLGQWTNPDSTKGTDHPEPPTLVFNWGRFSVGTGSQFACHMHSVTVEYVLFSKLGSPLRANCTVKLKGVPSSQQGQNPTSGALEAARSAVTVGSETLPLVTHRQMGTPNHWRDVAEMNDIDNPFRVRAGTKLVVPSRKRRPKK